MKGMGAHVWGTGMDNRHWMASTGRRLAAAVWVLGTCGCSADDSFSSGVAPNPTWMDSRGSAEDGVQAQPDAGSQDLPQPNPFVRADSDPFSTFAADVDTASYDIFRRSVTLYDTLPPPGEVRLEEFVNYFRYDYDTPNLEDPQPFAISLAASAHITKTRTRLLRVGIQGAERAERDKREPANLVFLVDTSGSMLDENKLPLVQFVLHKTLDELGPGDRISIVTYAGSTRVALESASASERGMVERAIEGLEAYGGTNGASGIELAYEQARRARVKDGINHVLLCTDGDFNLGVTSDDALVELIERERRDGITLTALGFGQRNNDAMMERVTNAGNGVYSVLYSPDQANEYVHHRLMNSMVHIAKDMKIQVEFNPDLVFAHRLLGYDNRRVADADFRDDSVDGGEVGAGHQVTALYEIALKEADLPGGVEAEEGDGDAEGLDREVTQDELVRVKVRYEPPGSGENAKAKEVFASLRPEAVEGPVDEADANTRWAIGVATFALRLKGQLSHDDVSFDALREVLAPLSTDGADAQRAEFLSLFDEARSLLDN